VYHNCSKTKRKHERVKLKQCKCKEGPFKPELCYKTEMELMDRVANSVKEETSVLLNYKSVGTHTLNS
jgi:hypothetical protein